MRGQLWCRPNTLVSKRFDSSIVGIGVVIFDIRVCRTASARLGFEMLLTELRVGCFNSEGERERERMTPVRCCGILQKHGLMMTEVNFHTYIPPWREGDEGITWDGFGGGVWVCVGGGSFANISPVSTNHLTSLAHLSSSPTRDRSGYQTSAAAQTLPPSSPLFSSQI